MTHPAIALSSVARQVRASLLAAGPIYKGRLVETWCDADLGLRLFLNDPAGQDGAYSVSEAEDLLGELGRAIAFAYDELNAGEGLDAEGTERATLGRQTAATVIEMLGRCVDRR